MIGHLETWDQDALYVTEKVRRYNTSFSQFHFGRFLYLQQNIHSQQDARPGLWKLHFFQVETNTAMLYKNSHRNKKISTEEITLKFFAQLTNEQGLRLYERLKIDFEMFDYDPKPYLERCNGTQSQ